MSCKFQIHVANTSICSLLCKQLLHNYSFQCYTNVNIINPIISVLERCYDIKYRSLHSPGLMAIG